MTLTDVPVDRVVSLSGAEVDDLASVLAGDQGEPAPLVVSPPRVCRTPAAFAEAAVGALERAAVELLPAWLPEVSTHRADLGGLAAARMLAAEHARRSRYPRTFLTDLAVLALTGHRVPAVLPLRVRLRQLTRLVAEAFGRPRTVLLVDAAQKGGTARERDAAEKGGTAQRCDAAGEGEAARRAEMVVAGAEWVVHNGGPAVWLVGGSSERLPAVRVQVSGGSRADAGRPHPASTVEAALEAALAKQDWAAGRRWNQDYRSNALTPPVRLDLLWPQERCVVEIDGPEHCHPARYEQDRRRDVQLTLDGYAVLRFTNARIIHDVGAVVHQIGTYVRARRRDTAEGHHHGRR
ncbi:endonuclease domain-containing protein [Actinoplanes sp. URMC 104]|uniref:endonuclease domain-containing protein n=1 Tax=Actinoplanes sp. URMC 104 TaxID=3423409 RepID=UPI003F1B37DE